MKSTISLYQRYHSSRRLSFSLIDKSNFTYINILAVIDRCLKSSYKVLDLGCGTGAVALYVSKHTSFVDACDVSANAIDVARKNATLNSVSNVRFNSDSVEAYIKKTLYNRKRYDLVLVLDVLEHLREDLLVLKQVSKIIRRGGTLIISVPSKNALLYKLGLLENFDKRVGHLRRYNVTEIRKLILDGGFKVSSILKCESALRNMLFTYPVLGKCVGVINRLGLSKVINDLDLFLVKHLGESQLIIVAKKI